DRFRRDEEQRLVKPREHARQLIIRKIFVDAVKKVEISRRWIVRQQIVRPDRRFWKDHPQSRHCCGREVGAAEIDVWGGSVDVQLEVSRPDAVRGELTHAAASSELGYRRSPRDEVWRSGNTLPVGPRTRLAKWRRSSRSNRVPCARAGQVVSYERSMRPEVEVVAKSQFPWQATHVLDCSVAA